MTAVDLGIPDIVPPVSNSEFGAFRDCRRKWMLTHIYNLGLKRTKPVAGALSLGTKVHESLDQYYRDDVDPLDVIEKLFQDDFAQLDHWEEVSGEKDPELREKLQKERELAHAMLSGYMEWIEETGADEGLQLVGVETVIEAASAIPGVRLRGKLDQRLVRDHDQTHLFLDFKTAGDMKTPALTMPLDEQMKMYQLLERLDAIARSGGAPPEPVRGGLYRMLKKVKRTARAQPPFYETLEVQHNDHELQSQWRRMTRQIEEMLEIRRAIETADEKDPNNTEHQYWAYPRPSRDCTWKCDFFPVCPMMDDGSDWRAMLKEYYEYRDPYERYEQEETKDGSVL